MSFHLENDNHKKFFLNEGMLTFTLQLRKNKKKIKVKQTR